MYVNLQHVSLGIILKSEQKVEDMIAIMLNLHEYCPTLSTTEDTDVARVGKENFHQILLGR